MGKNEYTDDDVVIIGGSEWKPSGDKNGRTGGRSGRRKTLLVSLAVLVLLPAVAYAVRTACNMIQFPKSRPDHEIVSMLSVKPEGVPGVSRNDEEIMGVKLEIFSISGLRAHFADSVPDCSDTSVYRVTRSADYRIWKDSRKMLGDFVQDGKVLARDTWRAGFMAISDGNAQIGVSRGNKAFRYVVRHGGSFFRQMAIVSAGTRCERQYILKGKVTRCAYARDENGKMYFVQTSNAETLYGFADALIEYGFIDAVYVTGGAQPELFYRDADGLPHGSYTDDKPHKMVVWTR